MEQLLKDVPETLINGVLVILLSLMIGLELRRMHSLNPEQEIFGSDRTFTLIGILGFVLYIIAPEHLYLFITGAVALIVLLSIYYYFKIKQYNEYGFTKIVTALITYCIAPMLFTQPKWLVIMMVISVVVLLDMKTVFISFSAKFAKDEFVTLSKFLAMVGVVLPLLSRESIFNFMDINAYNIWLSVVVISGVSYLSYILNKFIIKSGGIVVSGIMGGLYSSTATTIILARKSKAIGKMPEQFTQAIVYAIAAMYFRILILVFIFNTELGLFLLPYFGILVATALAVGFFVPRVMGKSEDKTDEAFQNDSHPLEIKFAFIFALLFVLFSVVTHFTLEYFGNAGLSVLSIIIGATDVDPFLLNLFQGKYVIPMAAIAAATMQAVVSNNILKVFYAFFLGDRKVAKACLKAVGIVVFVNIVEIIIIYLS